MKRLPILLLLLLLLPAGRIAARSYRVDEIPNVQLRDSRRYVSDPDGLLAPEAVMRLDTLCAALRGEGRAEVAVVVVEDIAGGDTFSFAVELFRRWGVGTARDNNGLGVLLVRDLREIRMVTGGGLEGVLPDALCKRIQTEYMLPAFREGDYGAGLVAGMDAVAAVLRGADLGFAPGGDSVSDGALTVILLLVFGLPLLVLFVAFRLRKRCPGCGRFSLHADSVQVLQTTRSARIVERVYVCSRCGHIVRRRIREPYDNGLGGGSGPMIGGLGGFGRGGGSFGGGFGGGSFGGGGAGSRW